jgi:hypothetical protein
MGELGDSGFIGFTVDDDAELVRVYGLVGGAARAILDAALADGQAHHEMW